MTTLTEDEFLQQFSPRVQNGGDLFEYKHVRNTPMQYVWTIVGAERHEIASPGFHIVNRMGYVISESPWNYRTPDAYWYHDDRDYYTCTNSECENGNVSLPDDCFTPDNDNKLRCDICTTLAKFVPEDP